MKRRTTGGARYPALGAVERRLTARLAGGGHGSVRPKEVAHLAHRLGNQALRLLPGVEAHVGLRGQTHDLHGYGVWVRRDVVRQDQYRCLARTHEIARHGEDEVGVGAIHPVQEGVDHLHRDVGPAGAERWAPALNVVVVEEVWHLRTEPAGLR